MEQSEDTLNAKDLPFRPYEDVKEVQQMNEPTLTDPSHTTGNPADPTYQKPVNGGEEMNMTATVNPAEPKKKKKSKSRFKNKRGQNKPTGFEEYYVDAPMTPEEYREEKSLYDISKPIAHRIEDALLRYVKNRRLEPERLAVFKKYLQYGGIDVGPKMFTGVDERVLQQLDSEQAMIARGHTSVRKECSDLPIDFNEVVKSYLTSYFPYFFDPDTEEMVKLATVTIRNFLSYILYHDVCPEYTENIDAARRSCDIAAEELWKNQQFTAETPGDFNKACSTLFGGFFYDLHVEDNNWKNPKDGYFMTIDIARKVVKFAIAGAGTNSQATRFQALANQNALRAMRVEDVHGFEVTDIYPPRPDVCEFYKGYAPDLNPVGRLLGKAYRDPGKPLYDLSPEERLKWENDTSLPIFEFFLEESLLKLCYPGMKVITQVWELNCGFHYFEDVHTAYCSIYTVLANDLMLGWKKPSAVNAGDQDDAGKVEGENVEGTEEKKEEKFL
ncbi:hypothetical protein BBP40_002076 [Aspergillus hancockii]|nr:hypothetical protein BBP40_002076 [Aspergillus hancockii]